MALEPDSEIRITLDHHGDLRMWVADVPGIKISAGEPLTTALARGIESFRADSDTPYGNADPYARKYADTLEDALRAIA